jgi:hypothetical protein
MTLRSTRTHTRYFADEDLAPLAEVTAALFEDWEGRRPFMDEATYLAGAARLSLLNTAHTLLGEPVAE